MLCAILFFASNATFVLEAEAAVQIRDIKTSDAKYKAAKWAVEKDVLQLEAGNRFNKSGVMTEAALLKAFAKLDANYPYTISNDMVYNYYSELNIPLKGAYDKSKRNSAVTRGEFAVIYAAMFGLDLSEVQAVRYLYLNEITTGTTKEKTYESYSASKKLTRGELAVFLYRMNKKKTLRAEGLDAAATGADNKRITIPSNFVANESGDVIVETGTPGTSEMPENIADVMKEVQNVSIQKSELIANGVDYTRVDLKLKNSYGEDIDYTESLQFKVTSKYNNSDVVVLSEDADSYAKITTNPGNAAASTIYSDGGDLTFYVTAPKTTKSYKDTIYVELVNNTSKAYSTFKNKRIEIPIQYAPKAELRVSYEVYDAYTADYVGGGDQEQEKWAILPSTIPTGVVNIYDLDADEKTFKVTTGTAAEQGLVVGYEGASLSIAGLPISEFLFEKIVQQYFKENALNLPTLNVIMGSDVNGNASYDLPFSIVPSKYINEFSSGDPEEYAVLSYLVSLLPSSINEFSMAYYDSVKKIQEIFYAIPDSTVNNVPGLTSLKTPISGLVQLADTEYQNQLDAQKAKQTSHTKVKVSLVAPGGQIITNYRGPVVIEYNGVRQQVMFSTDTTNTLNDTGHKGTAVAIFDDLIYGESEVEVTLPYYAADTRYATLLNSLYNEPQTTSIYATKSLDDRACITFSEVAVVVDGSSSMYKYDPNNQVGTVAKQLINKMEADPTIAVRFNTKGLLEKKGTKDAVLALDSGLFSLQNRKGGTSMYRGVETAINNFESIGDNSVKKAIIIISDGLTNSSEASRIINLANANDIELHTITLGSQVDSNQQLMKRLAAETEGTYAHAADAGDLSTAVQVVYDKVICNFSSSTEVCSSIDLFEEASVTIYPKQVRLSSEVNANCTNVEKIQVRFYSGGADLVLNLKNQGHNFYELYYDVSSLNSLNLENAVEFIALDSDGKELYTKTVKVQ